MVEAFLLNEANGKLVFAGVLLLGPALSLSGCGGPVSAYHNIEGGAIALPRQPPPGADSPYPNLAAVPAAPAAVTPAQTASLLNRLPINSLPIPATEANPAALAGLTLPSGPPPVPNVPGLNLPKNPTPNVIPAPPKSVPVVAKAAQSAPVAIAFAPGSAILSPDMVNALTAIAPGRGTSKILAVGFGEATAPDSAALSLALALALERARAIADQLTAAGVPASAIILNAAAAGSGGFVQLVY
jgi:outer membrane protein OmpA-like peptidoglycan-associated protein